MEHYIQYLLTTQIDSIETLQNYCKTSPQISQMCLENKSVISKHLLSIYQVNYKDPSNFIYIYNKVSIQDYKDQDNKWNYPSLLKLYLKNYNIDKINCEQKNITSFPIYPNMTTFYGNNNKLTSFPIQPKMTHFYGYSNKLTTFPIQPEMKTFYGNDNQLTSFPIQPEMMYFIGYNNVLTSFPIQPKMIDFHGNNNHLTSFPIQPEMREFHGNFNRLTSFPEQPKMKKFYELNN